MSSRNPTTPVVIAFMAGFVLWFATSLLTGKREPWDASAYWGVAYPLAMLACAFFGYAWPERPWRWVLVLFTAQFIAMCVRNGELGNLWPLGLVMFGIIALPGVLVAQLASRLNGRSAAGGAE